MTHKSITSKNFVNTSLMMVALFQLGNSRLSAKAFDYQVLSSREVCQMAGISLEENVNQHFFLLKVDENKNQSKEVVIIPRYVERAPKMIFDRELFIQIEALLKDVRNVKYSTLNQLLKGLTSYRLNTSHPNLPDINFAQKAKEVLAEAKTYGHGVQDIPDHLLPYVKVDPNAFHVDKSTKVGYKLTPDPIPDQQKKYVDSPLAPGLFEMEIGAISSKSEGEQNHEPPCSAHQIEDDIAAAESYRARVLEGGPWASGMNERYDDLALDGIMWGIFPEEVAIINRIFKMVCEHVGFFTGDYRSVARTPLNHVLEDWELYIQKIRLISVMKMTWPMSFSLDEHLASLEQKLTRNGFHVSHPHVRDRYGELNILDNNSKDLQVALIQNLEVLPHAQHNTIEISFEFPYQSAKDRLSYEYRFNFIPIDLKGRFYLSDQDYVHLEEGIGLRLCIFSVDGSFEGLRYDSCQGAGILGTY